MGVLGMSSNNSRAGEPLGTEEIPLPSSDSDSCSGAESENVDPQTSPRTVLQTSARPPLQIEQSS